MTAREHLDQLDALLTAGTPLPWVGDEDGEWIWGEASSLAFGELVTKGADVAPADNARIVAAVNALPKLTAALRGVLDVHQQFVDSRGITRQWCAHDPDDSWPCPTVTAITEALQ